MTRLNQMTMLASALLIAGAGCERNQTEVSEESIPGVKPGESEARLYEPENPPAHDFTTTKPSANSEQAMTSHVAPTPNQLEHDDDVPDVKLSIVRPDEGAVISDAEDVELELDLQNYRTGKNIGQHVHVVVDNEPYVAYYDLSQPLKIDNLTPGTHVIRVFPSRHYHLSIKQPGAFDMVTFHVGKEPSGAAKAAAVDPRRPLLTYSRPKGEYPYEARDAILLDFYLTNARLGPKQRVVYSVDGEETTLTEWKPVILPALEPGEHEIGLKLVDARGKVIDNGGFNEVTRTITIQGEPQTTAGR